VHRPLKLFVTANFADLYSPVLLSMLLKNSDGNPVADPVEVSWADLAAQCPEMCTLQEMHRRVAASPRTQAKFWLLMDDLVDRYLLAIGQSYVGSHRSAGVINYMAIEDDYCSSGELGLAGFAINEEEPCEAQARGFTHGRRKVYGIPEPMGPEMLRQFQAISAAKPENAAGIGDSATAASALTEFLAEASKALVRCASSLQYEAATLPARQMQQKVPAEKFTPRQQELSRLDGGYEIDGTQRRKLEPTPEEPLGHIVAEEDEATLANRPVGNAYREVPLTGCHNSLLPAYRQPHLAFQTFLMLDDFGRHMRTTETSAVLQSLPSSLPWKVSENGEITDAISPQGTTVSPEEFSQDAERYARSFSRDARALHGHNHDHNCSFTCIKYVKSSAKKMAEKSLDTGMNIVCRFFFYVVLVFKIVEEAVERVVRIRRRGKEIITEPYVANSNEHNELGRVQVERHTPFRGATSDVGQCGVRCKLDFQFTPRAPVLAVDMSLDEELRSAEKPEADRGVNAENATGHRRHSASKRTLTYDKAEAFYGIRLQLQANVAMRRAAYSMLAMWQAAHNTDYYITKYGTKPLGQLQNLIRQFALGLRRLELEEQQERHADDAAVVNNSQDYKQRARRVTLRLAMAANRATWASCCEMALFIHTNAHVRKTYYPRDIYLSRLAYLSHTCLRLLNSGNDFLLEASDLMRQGITDLSALSFSAAAGKTESAPLSNVAKLAETTVLENPEIVQDLQDASQILASDDDADEDELSNEEADSEKEDEKACNEVEEA